MSRPVLDAVGVSARDLAGSVAFYTLLGFEFPALEEDDKHVEAVTEPGKMRLMIDDAGLVESLIGETPRPGNASAFALLYDTPAGVDEAAASIKAAGHKILNEPWDAFWGQRYATVSDPDGYRIDLFARL